MCHFLQDGLPQFNAGSPGQVLIDEHHAVPNETKDHAPPFITLRKQRIPGLALPSSIPARVTFSKPNRGRTGVKRRVKRFPAIEFIGRENLGGVLQPYSSAALTTVSGTSRGSKPFFPGYPRGHLSRPGRQNPL